MNRQPYRTPPCWWSPRLSPLWVRLWRPLRRRWGFREHGLIDVEVRGLEHLRQALEDGHGVLITPNHPTHADPFVLLEAADRLQRPFFFMTAWQVFAMTHRLGRRVLRQHGCFSINREGHDLRACRQAINIMAHGSHPLVIFPEGEVFHLNDRVMPFRRGAATAALLAARRGNRPVACVPCAMKFEYVTDPTPRLNALMDRLEQTLGIAPRPGASLTRRIHRFAEEALKIREIEHFGAPRAGRLCERVDSLVASILERLEARYAIQSPGPAIPERIKRLRHRAIERLESTTDREIGATCERDLDDLFLATQLFSYQIDYVAQRPTVERLAETLDKLEEDVLGVRTASVRGIRRAVVSFGEPVTVGPRRSSKVVAAEITATLQERVQRLLDEINDAPAPALEPQPAADAAPLEPALESWLEPATA